jgi:hypothetical protein
LVITDTVQLSMWWTALCLRIRGLKWCNPRLMLSLSYPARLTSLLWQVRPPERLNRIRPAGRHKHVQRQQQYQQALDELSRGPSFTDRLF